MGPELSIDIAEKLFAGFERPLFKDFRLTVAPATVVALVGRSGVGKSTLLRLLAGIDTNYAGSIRINGAAALTAPPAGLVFQDPRLLPWLTVLDNIVAVRPGVDRERARALLARVGLAGYEAAFPHQLSGGMQRRVALARAVSVNSGFWLLDEPFVSLDRQLADQMHRLVLQLSLVEAPTVVLVTHQPEDAARLADRAIVLAGRPAQIVADVALEGRPSERSPALVGTISALLSEHLAAADG